MNKDIEDILEQVKDLEQQLVDKLAAQQERLYYQIEEGKVAFHIAVQATHLRLRTGIVSWLAKSQLRNILSIPFIYPLIIIFVLLDVCVTLYQWTCFRLYRIPLLKRNDYFIFDRHYLQYLNAIQRLNCFYCSYVNGVIAYVREIAARTEQYWCPIKHARRIRNPHSRYAAFSDYGDAQNYASESLRLRKQVTDDKKAQRHKP